MTAGELPIKRLTLYKHGVGFVEREGTVRERQVQLVFRRDELNDALKSLLVIDHGGTVQGIHYETPTKVSEGRFQLAPDHSLLDLLRNLRGRQVCLTTGESTVSGTLVGVEVDPEQPLRQSLVTLLEAERVLAVALADLRAVELLEGRAAEDLRYFLDSSRNDEGHRTVTLQLEGEGHALCVSYLVPSPTWRVTYRLVAEGAADSDGGKVLLQGWGLFDNRLEEDLEAVQVRLVAGQPLSFIYDLAASEIPVRPTVLDEARVAPGPIAFEGRGAAKVSPMMATAPTPPRISRAAVELQPPVEARAVGELFEYAVGVPVTVRRGESALVPILNRTLDYKKTLLYNGRKLPSHPVAALEFTNSTGLVLERGPATLIEDGEYRGEAVVPFTPDGANLYLTYAVELGIKVSEYQSSASETVALNLDGAYFQMTTAMTTTTVYRIANDLTRARTVTIEHPYRADAELVDPPAADETTAEYRRWQVTCAPRTTVQFSVRERQYSSRTEQIRDLDYTALHQYLERRWLDEATFTRLSDLLTAHQQVARNQEALQTIEPERGEIYRRQEQLRQNLSVLSPEGVEAPLRARLLAVLSASEERLEALLETEAHLKQAIATGEQAIQATLTSLENPAR